MSRINFDLPKVRSQLWTAQSLQSDQHESLNIFSRGEAGNIKFGQ